MTVAFVNTPAGWSERASTAAPWEACGWSRDGQTVRHLTVLRRLDPQPSETLLDYGCGTGELAKHVPVNVNYIGYDWADAMVARARADHPTRTFTTVEPCSPVDLVAAIGTFNLADRWTKRKTWETLERLWRLTARRLAVCLYAGSDPRCIRYTAREAAGFAESQSDRFTVKRGHYPGDLLMVLLR